MPYAALTTVEGSRTEQEKPEWSVDLRKSQTIKWEALQEDYQNRGDGQRRSGPSKPTLLSY